jgi:hypothetical protein
MIYFIAGLGLLLIIIFGILVWSFGTDRPGQNNVNKKNKKPPVLKM